MTLTPLTLEQLIDKGLARAQSSLRSAWIISSLLVATGAQAQVCTPQTLAMCVNPPGYSGPTIVMPSYTPPPYQYDPTPMNNLLMMQQLQSQSQFPQLRGPAYTPYSPNPRW